NPVALRSAIAPHLAAEEQGVRVDRRVLNAAHRELARRHDLVLVEGAGGWQVPLDRRTSFADWVADQGWPVLLVVGMRLGCINHALLSAESIVRRTRLAGWVANVMPSRQPRWADNLASLEARMPAPLLGVAGARRGAEAMEFANILSRLATPP